MMPRRTWSSVPTLLLTACAVGPTYMPPKTGADGHWIASVDTTAPDERWWRSFNDPLLDQLVQQAAASNLDLVQASARLREARANRDAVAGQRLPQLDLNAAVSRNAFSENGPIPVQRIPGFQRDYNLFDAGFDASWEIDLWGRNASAVRAARARTESAQEARRDVLMQVITEVARSYVDLRSAQQQLASAQADAQAQSDVARLVNDRWNAGEASRFDFARADTQARSVRAALPDLEAQAQAAVYRLAVLTAQPPESLTATLLPSASLPSAPAAPAVGLRADLLRRRPDLRRAERELAAASADVKVATADLFPRLSLVGSVGQQSLTAHDFLSSASTTFSIGPSLHWPVFAGGTLRANLRAAGARADAATAAYESAVLTALGDSETALSRFAAAEQASAERQGAHEQAQTALLLARQRYEAGEDDLTALLDAQSADRVAERESIAAQAQVLTALIGIYKALGGGWESFEASGS
jgi:NodT family efflux transporter outer membrane factor (OMF) lipoprotein